MNCQFKISKAERILNKIKAEEELIRLGWVKEVCHECKGKMVIPGDFNGEPLDYPCFCEDGFKWNEPIQK